MAQVQEYIVGTSPVPDWLPGRLWAFKKMDGGVGYEYRYRRGLVYMSVDLYEGDSIIRYAGRTYFNRSKKRQEDEGGGNMDIN